MHMLINFFPSLIFLSSLQGPGWRVQDGEEEKIPQLILPTILSVRYHYYPHLLMSAEKFTEVKQSAIG